MAIASVTGRFSAGFGIAVGARMTTVESVSGLLSDTGSGCLAIGSPVTVGLAAGSVASVGRERGRTVGSIVGRTIGASVGLGSAIGCGAALQAALNAAITPRQPATSHWLDPGL
jgi:hypothetical protein